MTELDPAIAAVYRPMEGINSLVPKIDLEQNARDHITSGTPSRELYAAGRVLAAELARTRHLPQSVLGEGQ